MLPVKKKFTLVRGDTMQFGFTITTETPIVDIAFSCRRTYNDNNYIFKKDLSDGITLDEGIYTVRVAPEDTENIVRCGLYHYDLEVILGDDVYTLMEGDIDIRPDVTRR